MKKEETIRRYGVAAYEKHKARVAKWEKDNPEKVAATKAEQNRKGGKHYDKTRLHQMTGLPHLKVLVRGSHSRIYGKYKRIIDPTGLTHLHHQWIPNTPDYTGVALVEKNQHQHGYIDVIKILEGEITLMTEESIRSMERSLKTKL